MLLRLLPMLATPARPFDDPAYLFEIKWDGFRGRVRPAVPGSRHDGADELRR